MALLVSGGVTPPGPETFLAIAVAGLALAAAHFRWRWLGWWERPLARLARRKRLAVASAAAAPLLLRALLLPLHPVPEPRVHDEFSFLLAADTFVHGRLVNPQHPFWMHFESFHVLVRPVYASVFPIAQAAALAVGKLLGHPWTGVWLSTGFLCGAICWMLQGWLPPRWALLGALLVVLRIGVASYWMNTYWGGSVAAAGGALLLGALPRMMRAPHWRHGVIMGAGLLVLANSRPVEGAFLGLAVAVWAAADYRAATVRKRCYLQVFLPLVLSVILGTAGMGYYFARVTGKPWVVPYAVDRSAMAIVPHFLWQRPGPIPLYDNSDIRGFYLYWEMGSYRLARQWPDDLRRKTEAYWHFYVGPLLSIPLLTLPLLWRNRIARRLLLVAAFFSLSLVGQVWHNVHYAAPATGLAILIVMLGMRRLRIWRFRGIPTGLYLVRCLPAGCVAMLAIQSAAAPVPTDTFAQTGWRWPSTGGVRRARVLRQLEHAPRQHLVLVRYSPWHDSGDEWVYNDADIDGSRVVWARELDGESNARLIRYFAGRRVWLIEPEAPLPVPHPYSEAASRPMLFVPVGAPGIAALRSPEQLAKKVLETVTAYETSRLLRCDVWNFYFTRATGVLGPNVTGGCFTGDDRTQEVSFEHWFSWLRQQR